MNGDIYDSFGKHVYKLEGRWNKEITLTNIATGFKEIIWTKNPYPEKVDLMYGMSHFML